LNNQPKGTRIGGRKKGTPNKASRTVKERLAVLGCDVIEYMALTVNNNVPCGVCRGSGKTKFQPAGSERFSGERTCQSCWGSKLERLTPRERLDSAKALLAHTEPMLKAIEHTGTDGGAIKHAVTITYIE